jgi:hypothetical protein
MVLWTQLGDPLMVQVVFRGSRKSLVANWQMLSRLPTVDKYYCHVYDKSYGVYSAE